MAKLKKKPISQSEMTHILQRELGYGAAMGTSIFTLMARVLSKRGVFQGSAQKDRDFVYENADFLKSIRKEPASFAPKPKRETYVKPINSSVASKEFLTSYEWRRLRMQAITIHGAKCQCCGATPATGAVINVDHVKPRKLYPELALDINNLQILCHECNHGKGNWDQTDWRQTTTNISSY